MRVQVPPDGWGGNIYTLEKVRNLAQAVVEMNATGLMLWSLPYPPNAPSLYRVGMKGVLKTRRL
jgi:chitinase